MRLSLTDVLRLCALGCSLAALIVLIVGDAQENVSPPEET